METIRDKNWNRRNRIPFDIWPLNDRVASLVLTFFIFLLAGFMAYVEPALLGRLFFAGLSMTSGVAFFEDLTELKNMI